MFFGNFKRFSVEIPPQIFWKRERAVFHSARMNDIPALRGNHESRRMAG
jgi:hypothetical protein